jgi:hypothetical protein
MFENSWRMLFRAALLETDVAKRGASRTSRGTSHARALVAGRPGLQRRARRDAGRAGLLERFESRAQTSQGLHASPGSV